MATVEPKPEAPSEDPARWFWMALVPQVFWAALFLSLAHANLAPQFEELGKVLPPATDWVIRFTSPARLAIVVGAILLLGLGIWSAPISQRISSAALPGLGALGTFGTLIGFLAYFLPFYFLMKGMDGDPWAERRWGLIRVTFLIPMAALIRTYLAGEGRYLCAWALAHVFFLASAVAEGFQLDVLEGVQEVYGRLPWDLAHFFVGAPQSIVAALLANLVLGWLIWRHPKRYAVWGPWFILILSSITTVIAVRKVAYYFNSFNAHPY